MTQPNTSKNLSRTTPEGVASTDSQIAAVDVAGLMELLESQRQLYQRLDEMSRQQKDQISGGELPGLLEVLGQRQELIDRLGQVHRRLDPYRRNWDRLLGQLPEAVRQRAGELIHESGRLLSGIIERDEQDRKQLEQARGKIGGELSRMAKANAAMQAYQAKPTENHNRFTDRKG